jgi:hypothetical protein
VRTGDDKHVATVEKAFCGEGRSRLKSCMFTFVCVGNTAVTDLLYIFGHIECSLLHTLLAPTADPVPWKSGVFSSATTGLGPPAHLGAVT